MKYCENCGKPLADKVNNCPYCGTETDNNKNIDLKIRELKEKLLREKELLSGVIKNKVDNVKTTVVNVKNAVFSKTDEKNTLQQEKPAPLPNPVKTPPTHLPNPVPVRTVTMSETDFNTSQKKAYNEKFSPVKVSDNAKITSSFSKGEYIKSSSLGVSLKSVITVIIISLLILGTLFLNYTFSATAMTGIDPVYSLFKINNNYDALLNALTESGSKNLVTFKHVDVAMIQFLCLAILNIVFALIIKNRSVLRFFTNLCTTMMLLIILSVGAVNGFTYGFSQIFKGLGVLSAAVLIIVLYFVINISYQKIENNV